MLAESLANCAVVSAVNAVTVAVGAVSGKGNPKSNEATGYGSDQVVAFE